MTNLVHCVMFQLLLIVFAVSGWKAIPANEATYSLRPKDGPDDHIRRRTTIHSIYKFGWCTPDAIQKPYLRKTANITVSDYQSSQASYIYLLENGDTIDHRLACIVMTLYVSLKDLFRFSRIPIYYCQGDLHFVYMMTYTRLDIHEFYLHQKLNLAVNFFFEFYHPTKL